MKLRTMRWAGHVACMEKYGGKTSMQKKKNPSRPRRRLDDNIKLYLKKIGTGISQSV
jgi:hypothetical protein